MDFTEKVTFQERPRERGRGPCGHVVLESYRQIAV